MDQTKPTIVVGNIYSYFGLNGYEKIECFMYKQSTFEYCGSVDGLKQYFGEAVLDHIKTSVEKNAYDLQEVDGTTIIIYPKEKMILPGFIDSHCHPISGGTQENKLKLHDCQSWEEAKTQIIPYLDRFSSGQWIFIYGYSQSWFNEIEQTIELLDSICQSSPLILMRDDTHSYWINSVALNECKIDLNTEIPPGGVISRDSKGNLNGSIAETAMNLVRSKFPKRTIKDHQQSFDQGMKALIRNGIVGFCDAAVKETMLDIYLEAYKTRDPKPWAYLCLCWNQLFLDQTQNKEIGMSIDHLDSLFELYKRSIGEGHIDPNELYCGSVKLFIDGVVESKTALLNQPYCGCHDHGQLMLKADELKIILKQLSDRDLQAHIHSIGDGATDLVIETFAELELNNTKQLRNYLAHLQFVSPAALTLYAKYNLGANFSPLWFYEDPQMSVLNQYVDKALLDEMYPIQQLMKLQIPIGFGSDWPVSSLNPLQGIERAVTRQPLGHKGDYIPIGNLHQRVSLTQALHFYTLGSAYLLHNEQFSGSIQQGKRNDFIVLSQDLFQIEPYLIGKTQVENTYLKGRAQM